MLTFSLREIWPAAKGRLGGYFVRSRELVLSSRSTVDWLTEGARRPGSTSQDFWS